MTRVLLSLVLRLRHPMAGRRSLGWAGYTLGTVLVGLRPGAAHDVSPSRRAPIKWKSQLRAPEGDLDAPGPHSWAR